MPNASSTTSFVLLTVVIVAMIVFLRWSRWHLRSRINHIKQFQQPPLEPANSLVAGSADVPSTEQGFAQPSSDPLSHLDERIAALERLVRRAEEQTARLEHVVQQAEAQLRNKSTG